MNWVSVRNPITIKDVESVEKELKIKLPKDYKEKIGPINGGALKKACVVCDIGRIPYSRNVSLVKTAKGNVFELLGGMIDGKHYFPFANVGNGDLFCFDLKKKRVVLWMHETDDITYICDTFTDLLNMIES